MTAQQFNENSTAKTEKEDKKPKHAREDFTFWSLDKRTKQWKIRENNTQQS